MAFYIPVGLLRIPSDALLEDLDGLWAQVSWNL